MRRLFLSLLALCFSVPSAFAQGVSTDNTWTSNYRFRGLDPFVDVTAMGARVGGTFNEPQGNWATCNGNSPVVNLSTTNGGYTFQNGDGIVIDHCGGTNTMSTPAAPSVTPATAASPTGTEWYTTIPAGMAGASSYSYAIIAADLMGGTTAVSPTATIANGQSALGGIQYNISSISVSNNTITVTTTAPNVLGWGTPSTSGTEVHIATGGSNTGQMSGYFAVCSVVSNTTFTLCNVPNDSRNLGWNWGDVGSQTTGTVNIFVSNHLHWTAVTGAFEYYICGLRPGDVSMKLIGVSKAQGLLNHYQDTDFDDFGSPMMDNMTFPRWISNASCSSATATNDMYTGIVTSGGGTTTLTVSPNTTQSVSGQFTAVDAGPVIVNAANAAVEAKNGFVGKAYVFLPQAETANMSGAVFGYSVFSPMVLPAGVNIEAEGDVQTKDTIVVQGGTTWSGRFGAGGNLQFGWGSYSGISASTTRPALYIDGPNNTFDHMQVTYGANGNGETLVVQDDASATHWDHVNLAGNAGSNEFMGMLMVIRETTNTINFFNANYLSLTGGSQTGNKMTTPFVWYPIDESGGGGSANCGNEAIYSFLTNISSSGGGFAITNNNCSNGPGYFQLDGYYRQGGIMPVITTQNGNFNGTYSLHNISQDTEGNPVFACLAPTGGSCGSFDLKMFTGSPNNPIFSGSRPTSAHVAQYGGGPITINNLPNRGISIEGNVQGAVFSPYETSGSYLSAFESYWTFTEPIHEPSGYSWFFDMSAPSSVAATAAAGGSVPAGNYYYCVLAAGYDFGESICSAPSASVTTGGGSLTVNLTWTNPLGSQSSNIYRCSSGASCLSSGVVNPGGGWTRVALHVTGASYSDTNPSTTAEAPPFVTGSGVTAFNNKFAEAPLFVGPETIAPSGVAGFDQLYADSTAHSWKKIENNGTVFNVAGTLSGTTGSIGGAALTAGQCASGTVSVSGATTSMTVSVSPNTYPGDGMIPWGYVSASGTVTVKVCAEAAGTPTSSTYNVRAIQ